MFRFQDPYTEPGKDTRNIAGLNVAVVVTDVQDVPPIFTLAPPLTRINNSIQPVSLSFCLLLYLIIIFTSPSLFGK